MGFKFVTTGNKIERVKLKTELEQYEKSSGACKILKTMKDHFIYEMFRPSLHLIQGTRILLLKNFLLLQRRYYCTLVFLLKSVNNLTKEEYNSSYSLRDDSTVILKAPDTGSVVAVQYRDDYLKEVANQLEDKDVYEEN